MNPTPTDPADFRQPVLRHLAWIARTPQLLTDSLTFYPADQLPADWEQRLRQWDAAPERMPAILAETPARRLGLYFEQLYQALMEDLLGWELLARNRQIAGNPALGTSGNGTVGELDFLLRRPDGLVEHHEIAVKFYLGYPRAPRETVWYGPNARDRLDLKVARLREHQSQLAQRREARQTLRDLGVVSIPQARIFLPGYLFQPLDEDLAAPDYVPANHLRGYWCYSRRARTLDTDHWVPLYKPHWLGPWLQPDPPDIIRAREALQRVEVTQRPQLFAALSWDEAVQQWRERLRIFVVPDQWPLDRENPD